MSYNQYNQNPYQQDSTQDSSYGYGQANPYAQDAPAPGNNQYEMQDYSQQAPAATSSLSQQEFLNRVQKLRDEIKGLTDDVDYIGQLHQRTLSSTDGSANHDLEQYVTQTQIRNTAIKDGIKGLERDLAKTNDSTRTTKTTQLQSLNTFFKSELNKYQSIESDYRQRYRDQIARQYRIVNPDASEQEVQEAASADWGNEGVFQTALRTNRTGHASSVLGNVRARHSELQRIEQTLNELSVLFQELATVVEQQEPVINAAEQNAISANDHMIKGNEQVEVAKKHALNRRKLKWWCALVVLLIIIAIAVGVGVGVSVANNNKK